VDILYCTADEVGTKTGGGIVTYNEIEALQRLGKVHVWDRAFFHGPQDNVFGYDGKAYEYILNNRFDFKLAHFYSGTFSKTVRLLKDRGVKVSYTAAAHDIEESKRAHLEIGMPFDYPHLTDPKIFTEYVSGYRMADLLICPSERSSTVMRRFDCTQKIEVIPHGVHLPEPKLEYPKTFTVGYLGSTGADKGLMYLLQAWKKAALKDSVLHLAGAHVPNLFDFVRTHGGGNIILQGFVPDVKDFYSAISVYCQPSITEGFGIEVVEALAHGRPVICSTGAGAVDAIKSGNNGYAFKPRDVEAMVTVFKRFKKDTHDYAHDGMPNDFQIWSNSALLSVKPYDWKLIQQRYVDVWSEMINPKETYRRNYLEELR
jgi:glycosyltransferase involved in cell wall biosynthesis